ncbi:hypothetical protein HDK64DRAFT_258517 [Phyllosticta capitalensis]
MPQMQQPKKGRPRLTARPGGGFAMMSLAESDRDLTDSSSYGAFLSFHKGASVLPLLPPLSFLLSSSSSLLPRRPRRLHRHRPRSGALQASFSFAHFVCRRSCYLSSPSIRAMAVPHVSPATIADKQRHLDAIYERIKKESSIGFHPWIVAGGRSGTIEDFSVDRLRTLRHCFFAKADAEHVKAKLIHWVSSEERETNQYQTSTGTTISLADIRHVLDVLCEEEGKVSTSTSALGSVLSALFSFLRGAMSDSSPSAAAKRDSHLAVIDEQVKEQSLVDFHPWMVSGEQSGSMDDFSVDQLTLLRHCFITKPDVKYVKTKIVAWVRSEERRSSLYQTSIGTTVSLADLRHILKVLCEEENTNPGAISGRSRSEGQKLGKRKRDAEATSPGSSSSRKLAKHKHAAAAIKPRPADPQEDDGEEDEDGNLAAIIPADRLHPARVQPFPVPSELHPASEAAFTSLWTTSGRWRSLINIDFLTPNAM